MNYEKKVNLVLSFYAGAILSLFLALTYIPKAVYLYLLLGLLGNVLAIVIIYKNWKRMKKIEFA